MKKSLMLLSLTAIPASLIGCGTTGPSPKSVSPFKTVHPPAATQTVGNMTVDIEQRTVGRRGYVEREAAIEAIGATSPIPEVAPALSGPQLIDPASGTEPS
jgi:hypothetical protein